MQMVVAGGSGFLGRALVHALAADGHATVVLSRGAGASARGAASDTTSRTRTVGWTPDGASGAWASVLDGADAVINLAGESIGGGRWTAARKRQITDSRILATRSLVAAIQQAATPPPVFISGSAVGYYGPLGDQIATEETPAGDDFLASVCTQWEAEAQRAASPRTRVVRIRTGLVLARDGGALPRMLPPFWFGAGGPIGSGRQYWPWIHRHDWVEMVKFAVATPAVSGALNLTAPQPLPNAQFARALGRALHRPSLLPTPGFALKLLLGEMAEGLLLSGQRAVPAKAESLGFRFTYPELDAALAEIFARR